MTLTDQLARFLKDRPNQWMSAREFERFGRQAWRTRISDCRKPPYNMRIENRVRVITNPGHLVGLQSRHFKVSEYRFVPAESVLESAAKEERPDALNAEPFSKTGLHPGSRDESPRS